MGGGIHTVVADGLGGLGGVGRGVLGEIASSMPKFGLEKRSVMLRPGERAVGRVFSSGYGRARTREPARRRRKRYSKGVIVLI